LSGSGVQISRFGITQANDLRNGLDEGLGLDLVSVSLVLDSAP
jgi:hypothetical protein